MTKRQGRHVAQYGHHWLGGGGHLERDGREEADSVGEVLYQSRRRMFPPLGPLRSRFLTRPFLALCIVAELQHSPLDPGRAGLFHHIAVAPNLDGMFL